MKRKKSLLGMGLLTVALLTGCNHIEEKPHVGNGTIQEDPAVSEMPKAAQSTKKENEEYKMQATNLTEQNQEEVRIDYFIEGYDLAQKFSYELFAQNMEKDNPVLSPVSAYLALALAGAGAEGETQKEFRTVLGDLEGIPNDLMTNLPRELEGMKLTLANSAWVDERLTLNQEWLAWADSVYRSEVYQTRLATEAAMEDMNQWIERNTNGLIPKLLAQPLEEETRLALFNTIYFKGDWKSKFSEEATRELDFTLGDGTVEQVEMMQQFKENLRYVRNEEAEGVILPYKDNSIAFVALKPVGEGSVREMYEQLSYEDISGFLQQKETTLCNLRLPKFEVEFDKELNDSLKAMGLQQAFEEGVADFDGLGTLDTGEGMFISLVRQKAKVIVDENGTEAAAVTAIMVKSESAMKEQEPPVNIYFDEPFLYMIMDMEREVPLFVGIMDNPNA